VPRTLHVRAAGADCLCNWGMQSKRFLSIGRVLYTADAYSKGGRLRSIVLSDDRLSAFIELERATRNDAD